MWKAMFRGLWRVASSPGLVVWLWLVNGAVTLPLAWALAGSIGSSVGGSLVADRLSESFDMGWYGEFEARAKGLETTFSPAVTGAGAFYNNIEDWFDGDLFRTYPGLVGIGVLYALFWALFLGGVLDRYATAEARFSLSRFFSHGGKFFFRFVRLAVLSGVLYYAIYRLSAWLMARIEQLSVDVTVERTVLGYTLLGAVSIVFLMTFVNMAFDYAKIAAFLEDRRSMLLAAFRGFRFVLRHPVKSLGLYYGLGAIGIGLLAAYASFAPGANQATPFAVVLAFLIGQAYLVVKLVLRLWFYAAQLSLYLALTAGGRASAIASTR